MSRKRVQEGDSLQWTNSTGTAVSSGDMVGISASFGYGVASVDIAASATGTVEVEGVFELPKVSATALAQGAIAYWDAADGEVNTDNGNTKIGYVWEAAGASATTVKIKLHNLSS